jgi:hypothetical protein
VVWTPKDRCLVPCRMWRSTRCDSQEDGCSAEFTPGGARQRQRCPPPVRQPQNAHAKEKIDEHQDMYGRTECPGWIRRAIAGGQRGMAGGSGPAGHLPKAMLALEQHACSGGPPPLACLGGCCEPADLLRRLRMRAVMSGAPPAAGSCAIPDGAQGPAQAEAGGRSPRRLFSPGGFPGLGWSSEKSRAAEMPGPEQVTDLPGPPQQGRPMRPAGGEQAGSPPRVLVLASWREQEVSGRRRRPRGGWPRDWPRDHRPRQGMFRRGHTRRQQ